MKLCLLKNIKTVGPLIRTFNRSKRGSKFRFTDSYALNPCDGSSAEPMYWCVPCVNLYLFISSYICVSLQVQWLLILLYWERVTFYWCECLKGDNSDLGPSLNHVKDIWLSPTVARFKFPTGVLPPYLAHKPWDDVLYGCLPARNALERRGDVGEVETSLMLKLVSITMIFDKSVTTKPSISSCLVILLEENKMDREFVMLILTLIRFY